MRALQSVVLEASNITTFTIILSLLLDSSSADPSHFCSSLLRVVLVHFISFSIDFFLPSVFVLFLALSRSYLLHLADFLGSITPIPSNTRWQSWLPWSMPVPSFSSTSATAPLHRRSRIFFVALVRRAPCGRGRSCVF